MWERLKKRWEAVVALFKSCEWSLENLKRVRYHIEEIKPKENKVVIRFRNSRIYIKMALDQALSRRGLVEHLHPLQACWFGYYYATMIKDPSARLSAKQPPLGFELRAKSGRFQVVALDEPSGMLTYVDKETQETCRAPVTDVAQNELVIKNIDATQACYIGMQAGFQVARHGIKILSRKSDRPVLKIVN